MSGSPAECRRSREAQELRGVKVSPHDDREPNDATLCLLLGIDVASFEKLQINNM